MLKKLLFTCITFVMTFAVFLNGTYAAVNVNTADEVTLQTVKGIGPVKAKAIIAERDKNGSFKDAADLTTRIKGIGTKSIAKLQQEGLTVEAAAAPEASATSAAAAAIPAAAQTSAAAGK